MDLALNNLQGLICHKIQQTKPNQTKPSLPVPLPILWLQYRAHQLQFVSPSPSRLIAFCYYYNSILESFSHQFYLMVFHWSLSDSKSPQVSRTLLSFLAVLNNVYLDGLRLSSYFQVLQSLFQSFGDCIKSTNHDWYNCHLHVP